MSRNLIDISNLPNTYGTMSNAPEVAFSGFSPTEFYGLCENITANIYTVNSSWRQLEQLLKVIGTKKDNQALRDKSHASQTNSNQIITSTSKDLQRLTTLVRRGDKQQKLQVEKLTLVFKEAVEKYYSAQKLVANSMKANLLASNWPSGGDMGNDGDISQNLQEQQLTNELAFDQEIILEREARIKAIEADILDVNQIMKELSALTIQQKETVDSIESRIETATGNVEQGTSELVKAARHQRRYRVRLYILIILGLIVVAVLIGVMVSAIKR